MELNIVLQRMGFTATDCAVLQLAFGQPAPVPFDVKTIMRQMRLLVPLLLISLGLSTATGSAASDKTQEIERIRKNAQALFDAKRYNSAFVLCYQILALDPYDQTARTQQEEINRIRTDSIRSKRKVQNGDEGLMHPTQPPQLLRSLPNRSK